ncbi:MAG: acyl carrier protein [Nevskiaceae bacterium]|nr:MAG: acyl carrier protein [Nevskiaceae bacterium]TBR74187.1 MAG: acyl carrier protein [Nevskiaceae bacterium]
MLESREFQRIREQVVAELEKTTKKPVEVTDDTHIVRDLEIDSLAVMNLTLALEDEFDISMPLERVAEVETVHDLIATVAELIEERAS